MPDDREQTDRIKEKLDRARRADPDLRLFGAETHRYVLGPPLDEREVAAFEEAHGISLPRGYRAFLTRVGDGGPPGEGRVAIPEFSPPTREGIEELEKILGFSTSGIPWKALTELARTVVRPSHGAGPGHGLYALRGASTSCEGHLRKPPVIAPGLTFEDWATLRDRVEATASEHEEGPADRLYAGILAIATEGCSYEVGILVQGPFAGRVVAYDLECCTRPEFAPETDFLDWYERWLDEVISGSGLWRARRSR